MRKDSINPLFGVLRVNAETNSDLWGDPSTLPASLITHIALLCSVLRFLTELRLALQTSPLISASTLSLSLVAALYIGGCYPGESQFEQSIYGEWTSRTPDDQEERILISRGSITWGYETDNEYSCPFRIYSYSEAGREMEINTLCKRRSGSELPVAYTVYFHEGGDTFDLRLVGRTVAVYSATSR